jgi:phosphoglycolate phosphatase-like HAD superfamily hydrolase
MLSDAIIFDFDGVLVESVDIKTRAFVELYARHGEAVMGAVERYHLGNTGISRFVKFRHIETDILGQPPLDKEGVERLAARFAQLVIDKVVAAPMVPGAQAFLDRQRGRVPMFVVSGTPSDELAAIIERRGLEAYFEGSWGSPGSKAGHIAELLNLHGLDAGRCLMIGDAMADYEGARANHVPFLGRVASGGASPFPPGTKTFTDFTELPEHL